MLPSSLVIYVGHMFVKLSMFVYVYMAINSFDLTLIYQFNVFLVFCRKVNIWNVNFAQQHSFSTNERMFRESVVGEIWQC